ncbi:MAG: hypothetical protein LWX51_00310 [Deltaproteobacteria bacterium]|jgi:hypothetical protein|nr:hypothetical protein [Deltaproteobacteria bacterium]
MEESTGLLSEVEEFLNDYRKDLYSLNDEAWSIFQECYRSIGIDYEHSHGFFIDIGKKIESMENFYNIKAKSEELEKARANCLLEYYQLASRNPNHNQKSDKWNSFANKVQEIINLNELAVSMLLDKASTAYEKIITCPYGKQKNKNINASLFEKKVSEFFDWLFISALGRVDLTEIETYRLRRDWVYKVRDEFDTLEKCGFPFRDILIECKNFAQPKYPSLMQVFVYTLSCQDSEISKVPLSQPNAGSIHGVVYRQDSEISKVPLSLLISRKNPDRESTIWRIRRAIFNKPMKKETRLILFLDDHDLGKMLENKQKGIDPALVLKEKIAELERSNIQHGGI